MDIIFKLLVLITPVPVTWFVYRFLREKSKNSDDIQANFSRKIKIRAVGVIASYLAVLSLMVFSFYPSLIGLELKNESEKWDFVIQYQLSSDSNSPKKERSGYLIASNKASGSKVIKGFYKEESDVSLADHRWVSDGFMDNKTFYIPLKLPNISANIVGLGSWNQSEGRAELKIFSLFQEDRNPYPVYGVMILEKRYPWLLLLLMPIVPLLVLFPLSKVGTLVHNFIDADIKLPIWDGSIKAKLSGASAAYLVCFAMSYLVFFEGVPESLSEEIEEQSENLQLYQGKWYYRLFHAGGSGKVEYTGQINIDTKLRDANVKGRMTKTWLSETTKYNCYSSAKINKEKMTRRNDFEPEYHWASESSMLVGNSLITVYKFIGANNENKGVLFSNIFDEHSKESRWSYYDLSDWRPDRWFINNGFIEAFRPTDKDYGDECRDFALKYDDA